VRGVAERLLGRAGRGFLRTPAVDGRAAILAYHNVVPDGVAPAGDDSLHLPLSSFGRQLDFLQDYCEVMPLERILQPAANGRLAVAITFDDGYRGTLTLGAAELARRGLPATVFVPPGLLDDKSFWWDDLADPVQGLADGLRARALGELRGVDADIRAAFPARAPQYPPSMRSGSVEELRRATEVADLRIGAHSWGHPNLAAIGAGDLDGELARPLAWIRERFPEQAIPWIAYPYGLSSAAVEAAAAAAGYVNGLLAEGGTFRRGGGRPAYAVPRVNVPAGVSLDGFALRLAGVPL
jgi:peptidoglycan/xylan/chitin deacetylase (PgdA/CDA1 family)